MTADTILLVGQGPGLLCLQVWSEIRVGYIARRFRLHSWQLRATAHAERQYAALLAKVIESVLRRQGRS